MTPAPDDDRLLRLWRRSKDEVAFHALCDRHAGLVAAVCRRLGSPDPDEATQAVFLVLARRAGSVDGRCLASWLGSTAQRVVANQRRTSRRRRQHEEEAAVEHTRHRDAAPAEPAWAEAREHLDAALASLSTGRREAVLRFYLEGRSQAEVAAELGCSEGAVKTRVHEGLERLRAFFARKGVALGAAALASGLAGESAAAEPALAASCAQAAIQPASAAGAATLANGVITTMFIKSAALACAAVLVAGSALTAAMVGGAEPAQSCQDPPPTTAPSPSCDPAANAALSWWAAIATLPSKKEPIWGWASNPDSWLTPEVDGQLRVRFVENPPEYLKLLAIGAASPYCDWGLQADQGGYPYAMQYLFEMPRLFRIAALSSLWQASSAGDHVTAVDELVNCLSALHHLAGCRPRPPEFAMAFQCESTVIDACAMLAPVLAPALRQRLAQELLRLPADSGMADVIAQRLKSVSWRIETMLRLPVDRRQAWLTEAGWEGAADLSDTALKASLASYQVEAHRWQAHLRRPLPERLAPLSPKFSAGDQPPFPWIGILGTLDGYAMLIRDEVALLTRRAQLLAAFAYLERGEAGLAAHPDPATGKPFGLEKTDEGFRMAAIHPGRGVSLNIGGLPAAHKQASAPTF